jgi:hypothetical protein
LPEILWMHKFDLGVTEPYPAVEVDHVNHDGLDNRKVKPRKVTKSGDQRGKTRNANQRSSSYKASSMILLLVARNPGG